MSYSETVQRHARIAILRYLAEQPDYSLNDSMVRELLGQLAIAYTRDQVRAELAWLAEQGLVTIEELRDLQIAKITERGDDVAKGRATVPGIKRPGPPS